MMLGGDSHLFNSVQFLWERTITHQMAGTKSCDLSTGILVRGMCHMSVLTKNVRPTLMIFMFISASSLKEKGTTLQRRHSCQRSCLVFHDSLRAKQTHSIDDLLCSPDFLSSPPMFICCSCCCFRTVSLINTYSPLSVTSAFVYSQIHIVCMCVFRLICLASFQVQTFQDASYLSFATTWVLDLCRVIRS